MLNNICRRKGEKKGKTYEDVISPYATSPIPVPSMFVSDNPAFNLNDEMNRDQTSTAGMGALAGSIPSYNTTPTSQRAMPVSGVYAEIGDVSGSSSQLPFTPDAGLQLGLQRPYNNNNRGSTDSGLYSTPSDRHIRNFEGPYATSTETLDSNRGNTPTRSPPLSPAQVEALYAKPVKVKKPKKPSDVNNEPPELPPVRYDLGDLSRTDDSSHNVSRDTIETDV